MASLSFLQLLRTALDQGELVKLVLARPQGQEPDLERVTVRPVLLKGINRLAFVFHHKTRDVTKNLSRDDGLAAIERDLGAAFLAAHLLTVNQDVHAEIDRSGKLRVTRGKAAPRPTPSLEHNRRKRRCLDPSLPWLNALGLTDAAGRVHPTMSGKWKQVNRFLEIFSAALEAACPEAGSLAPGARLRVLDFGAGKGYLTFAVHDYLCRQRQLEATVAGVEIREDLVSLCNRVALEHGCRALEFRTGQVEQFPVEPIDVLIALHACDTATDAAMHLGIRARARVIICSPCCHKELRPQLVAPAVLEPMLRFGVHAAQEADMITDTLRALLLEANGYHVQVFEFVSLEHTDRNRMILALRASRRSPRSVGDASAVPAGEGGRGRGPASAVDAAGEGGQGQGSTVARREQALARVADLKAFYGIREQRLETLLAKEPGEDYASTTR